MREPVTESRLVIISALPRTPFCISKLLKIALGLDMVALLTADSQCNRQILEAVRAPVLSSVSLLEFFFSPIKPT